MRALWFLLPLVAGCRILSGEVACERNRDCPTSVRFCDARDGGVGLCVEEAPPIDAVDEADAGVDPPPDANGT